MQPTSKREAFNPNMLILARESRGVSQQELAAALQVTQGRISKIEKGMLGVPAELLERISDELDYPVSFFFREGYISGVGVAELFHRRRRAVSQKVLDSIYAQIEIRRFEIEDLLKAVDIASKFPRLDLDEFNGHVEDVARMVRAQLNIPRGPIADLTHALEDAGAVVVEFDFGTSQVDAMSRWYPGLPPLFFTNARSPRDRRRFTLAHELGHLVMHETPLPDLEAEADRFAAEFLLPEREVKADLLDVSVAKLAVLKRFWRVSMAMLLKRAEDLGTITANRARMLWAQMAPYKKQEPPELEPDGERPTLLREIAESHERDLGYSREQLQDVVLRLNDRELYALYLQEPRAPRALHAIHAV